MAKFDGIFLFKILADIKSVKKLKPLISDGKLIFIDFKFNNINIKFRDSLLILPDSLVNLAKSFNCENKKSLFPVLFQEPVLQLLMLVFT